MTHSGSSIERETFTKRVLQKRRQGVWTPTRNQETGFLVADVGESRRRRVPLSHFLCLQSKALITLSSCAPPGGPGACPHPESFSSSKKNASKSRNAVHTYCLETASMCRKDTSVDACFKLKTKPQTLTVVWTWSQYLPEKCRPLLLGFTPVSESLCFLQTLFHWSFFFLP